MKCTITFMAAAAATAPKTSKSSLLEVGKMTPIEKVVNMLQNMQSEVEDEGKQDKKMYQKMDCWCNTNNGQKERAIKEAKKLIDELNASIQRLTATESTLQSEIESLSDAKAKNEESLAKATAMRKTAKAEFDAEESDLSKAVDQLSRAIETLKSNFGEFLQTKTAVSQHKLDQAISGAGHVARDLVTRFSNAMEMDLAGVNEAFPVPGHYYHSDSFATQASDAEDEHKAANVMDPELFDSLLDSVSGKLGMMQQPAGYKSYNAKSGKILGILKQMLEGMSGDLKDARDKEANSVEVFEGLKAAKTAEITSQSNSIDEKTQQLADTQVNLANDKQNLEDTSEDLELDEQFLKELTEKCATFEKQYAERTETRTQELAALAEAQKILADDDARDAMGGLGKGVQSFVQTDSSSAARARSSAIAVLRRAYRSAGADTMLLTLSIATQIDSFTKVKEAMDKMKKELKRQQEEEKKDKDECNEAIHTNERDIQDTTYEHEDLDDKVTTLTAQVETLKEEIQALEQEINEAQVGIKKAGEQRVEQSKAFQEAISDNRAAVKILSKVLDRLKDFYAPKTVLLDQPEEAYNDGRAGRATGDAPAEFKDYKPSQRSGGVLAMITKIIEDAEKEHEEMVSDEQTAQADYEKLVADSFAAIKKDQRSVIDRQEQLAQTKIELTSSTEDLANTASNLERLQKTNRDYHEQCDDILEHFDERQKQRYVEMEAIDEAKAMLSGMQ